MDLVAACRVFVQVGERGSFTLGASAAATSQSVASRRIAALEAHFGERLFDRTARRPALTRFGHDLLPSAKRLVQLADSMEYDAEQAKLRPLVVAVPQLCAVHRLARLDAAARGTGTALTFRAAAPAERVSLLGSREAGAALIAVAPDGAQWVVPLGVAGAVVSGARPMRIDALRASRARPAQRRLWLQPEDDVPHVRDRVQQLGHRAALAPAQIAVAPSLTQAVSDVLCTTDLLLCSRDQAQELELHWRPLAGEPVARGYTAGYSPAYAAERVIMQVWNEIAVCLGSSREHA